MSNGTAHSPLLTALMAEHEAAVSYSNACVQYELAMLSADEQKWREAAGDRVVAEERWHTARNAAEALCAVPSDPKEE